MKYYEVEGPTPQEALDSFLISRKISAEFATYDVLEQGAKGFLGFGRKQSKIKISFDDVGHLKKKTKVTLSEILDLAGFTEYRIVVKEKEGVCTFNIETPDSKVLIGKMAQTLDAIQYIVDKMIKTQEDDIIINVDVEGYRERAIAKLKEKAETLSQSVIRTGKAAKMPAMVPSVRKQLHTFVKTIPGVTTKSSGSGVMKNVFIVTSGGNKKKRITTSVKIDVWDS